MKRLLAMAFLGVICFVAGFSVRPIKSVLAQGKIKSEEDARSFPRAVPGKALYITGDELKQRFLSGPPAGKDRINNVDGGLIWDPVYRFSVLTKPYYDPPRKFRSGEVSHWEGPEMHEDKTQIYIIIGGTGSMALGGIAKNIKDGAEGQHTGWGPLEGATMYKFKPGDWIVIPPMTWHQSLPDPGQTIVYGMIHIETRNTRP